MSITGYAKEHASLLVFFMRLLDAAMVFFSGLLCFFWLEPVKSFPAHDGLLPTHYLNAIGVAILLASWWFPAFNVYRSWRGAQFYAEMRPLALSWAASVVGLVAFIFFTKSADEFSRHWLGLWFITALLAMMMGRMLLRLTLRRLRSQGLNLRHVVLVGQPDKCADIQYRINATPWLGLAVTGYFGDAAESGQSDHYPKHLGAINELPAHLNELCIDQVWLTYSFKEMDIIESICRELEKSAVEVMLVPDFAGWRLLNHSVVEINGLPLINLAVSPINGGHAVVKWLEDKLLATAILLFCSPFMILIALGVKLSSPGPVFYRQERVSWSGKPFYMLKFRSMPLDADSRYGQPVWGLARDKQPTRFGAWLRRTSLDELPQFINVLRGDMSIVGPRPERPVFVEQFRHEIDGYMQKHLVKAGITGWAQINGWRGDTCLRTRVEHDLYYIRHWSLWLDLKIILLTLTRGLMAENAG